MEKELYSFFCSFLSGALSFAVFDMCSGFKRSLPQNKAITAVSDIIFWLTSLVVTACLLWSGSFFKLRAYEFFAVVLGAVIYYALLHRLIFKVFSVFFGLIVKIFGLFFKILLTPGRFLYKILLASFNFIRSKIKLGKESVDDNV